MQATVTTNNVCQGSVRTDFGYSPGNLPMGDVSITQLNDALSGGHQATPARVDSDPPFGTHIREAVAIVKDWMRDR